MAIRSISMRVFGACRWWLLVALATKLCGVAATAHGQQPNPEPALEVAQADSSDYLGAARCAGCHSSATRLFSQDYVLLDEYTTWSTRDKHAVAYVKLLEKPAQDMGRLLQIDAAHDQSCLGCHANWRLDRPRPEDDDLQQGVSCESCHGPSRKWDLPHSKPAWRTLPAADKAALGMINFRDPLERAHQCLSCHVGNRGQGKVLTHEMYAAGHPPLASFEIESARERMPPHWRRLEEKDKLKQDEVQQLLQLLGRPEGSIERAKGALVGGVLALRQSVDLLPVDNEGTKWPDFAQFDCAMCHHELQRPSWRQARSDAGKLGRPQLTIWPEVLVTGSIAGAAGGNSADALRLSTEFQQRIDRLRGIYSTQIFGISDRGDANEVQAIRSELTSWLDRLAEQMNNQPCDRPAALAALQRLCDHGSTQLLDYDSARQVAWAFHSIYADLSPPLSTDGQIKAELASLDQFLQLRMTVSSERPPDTVAGAWYAAIGKYDPRKFQERIAALAKALSAAE